MLPASRPLRGLPRLARAAWRWVSVALLGACAAQGRPATPAPAGAGPVATAAARVYPILPPAGPKSRCLATLPDSVLRRRDTVYVHAFIPDSAARELLPQADVLAQRVAWQVRLLLGAAGTSLPEGEPLVTWRTELGGDLVVTMHRDGRATWSEVEPPPFTDSAAAQLLARGMAAVTSAGERIAWAGETAPDSAPLRLVFGTRQASTFRDGMGLGFPVFVLREPPMSGPEMAWHPKLRYPGRLKGEGVGAHLIMQLVVDTLGGVEPGSIRDVLPTGIAPLAGRNFSDYEAFVREAQRMLTKSRFRPGKVGDCRVRFRVLMPFTFSVVTDRT